ncbi:hypothetical protein CGRA01v4_06390 [Colletotrichum graminicola]|nr:hypothetical protein CGRA01v4_06390 [Colletotrichum graminicola]
MLSKEDPSSGAGRRRFLHSRCLRRRGQVKGEPQENKEDCSRGVE